MIGDINIDYLNKNIHLGSSISCNSGMYLQGPFFFFFPGDHVGDQVQLLCAPTVEAGLA